MFPQDPATWWAAFGAVAQAAGALATLAAVVLSLWIVLSERALKASGSANISSWFDGDGTLEVYLIHVRIQNDGIRPFKVTDVGFRTGWFSGGPEILSYRTAIVKDVITLPRSQGPYIIEPSHGENFYQSIDAWLETADSESTTYMFDREVPLIGHAPIRAMVHISGRKPLIVRVDKRLAKFLRSSELPSKGTV